MDRVSWFDDGSVGGGMYQRVEQPMTGVGTAVAAMILGALGAATALVRVYSALNQLSDLESRSRIPVFGDMVTPPSTGAYAITIAWLIAEITTAALLGTGVAQLLRRRRRGQTVMVIGCGWSVLAFAIGMYVMVELTPVRTVPIVATTVLLVFPLTTLVLAALPSTGRWCRS